MRLTEQESWYDDLEKKSSLDILREINNEDQKVALCVEKVIPQISELVEAVVFAFENKGRLFYIGAGTSGRLGIVDASECPPTFGVDAGMVVGLIAGGDAAIRKAIEYSEDDKFLAWQDLQEHDITSKDIVIGLAASGTTPYVVHGLKKASKYGIPTGCITCNPNSMISKYSKYAIEVAVGPEYLTGSTRMKAGTAQKMILNMISTASMIRIGRVKGNKMVDMQIANHKLHIRAIRMIRDQTGSSEQEAKRLLNETGSVRLAVDKFYKQ